MRVSAILAAAVLVVGTAAGAHANLVSNGDFSSTTLTTAYPTQFGTGSKNGYTATQFINSWLGNDGYEIWYPSAAAATADNATGEWTSTGEEKLYPGFSPTLLNAPPGIGAGTFVGLDGDVTPGVQSSIKQWITGLTVGAHYSLTFDWAGSQLQSRTGATTEKLQVSLGGSTQDTATLSNVSKGFTGWYTATMDFVAGSTSDWLTFLSIGAPTGYPPVALLTNVSLTPGSSETPVPEPSTFALLGAGLLGLVFVARRRTASGKV